MCVTWASEWAPPSALATAGHVSTVSTTNKTFHANSCSLHFPLLHQIYTVMQMCNISCRCATKMWRRFMSCSKSQTWNADFPLFFCITNVTNQATNSWGSLNRMSNLLLHNNFEWSFLSLSNFEPLKSVGNPLIGQLIVNESNSKWHQTEFCLFSPRLSGLFCP